MADYVLRWQAEDFHDACKLFYLVFTRKQWISRVELGQDAAQTPHIDRRTVRKTEDHFRAPVKSRLYIRVDALVTVARRAEVDDFDQAASPLFQQYVLLQQQWTESVSVKPRRKARIGKATRALIPAHNRLPVSSRSE